MKTNKIKLVMLSLAMIFGSFLYAQDENQKQNQNQNQYQNRNYETIKETLTPQQQTMLQEERQLMIQNRNMLRT
ncbi:MAG: hypothetical protein WBN17_07290, partial [Aureibaculum sp.]